VRLIFWEEGKKEVFGAKREKIGALLCEKENETLLSLSSFLSRLWFSLVSSLKLDQNTTAIFSLSFSLLSLCASSTFPLNSRYFILREHIMCSGS